VAQWRATAECARRVGVDTETDIDFDASDFPLVPTAEDVDSMHRWAGGGGDGGAGGGGKGRDGEGGAGGGDTLLWTASDEDDSGDESLAAGSVGETARLMARLGLLTKGTATTMTATAAKAATTHAVGFYADEPDGVVAAAVAAARRNNFAIMDPLLVPVAAACYPLGALLNHSCAPNCVVTYRRSRRAKPQHQPTDPGSSDSDSYGGGGYRGDDPGPGPGPCEWIQEFRCVHAVALGEELCHAYVDASAPPEERVAELHARYGFVCGCPRCPSPADCVPVVYLRASPSSASAASGREASGDVRGGGDGGDDGGDVSGLARECGRRGKGGGESELLRPSPPVSSPLALSTTAEAALGRAKGLLNEAAAEDDLGVERRKAEEAVAILLAAEEDHTREAGAGEKAEENGVETTAGVALSTSRGVAGTSALGPSPLLTWRLRGIELALNAAMLSGDWSAAATHGASLVAGREAAYGTQYHPRVGLDLVTLGSVLSELGKSQSTLGAKPGADDDSGDASRAAAAEAGMAPGLRDAKAVLRRALEVLRVTAGCQCRLSIETRDMLHQM